MLKNFNHERELLVLSFMQALPIRFKRLRHGVYTLKELFLWGADVINEKFFHKSSEFYVREHVRRVLAPDGECYHVKDVKLPLLDSRNERILAAEIFNDTFESYIHFNDNYDERVFDECEKFLSEGLYGLVNDKVNVTVEPGDIVIDAGSWVGDFAAYASVKVRKFWGGIVYAFEPSKENFKYLEKTAQLNGNIVPVQKGISNKTSSASLSINTFTAASSFTTAQDSDSAAENTETVETVSIDDFVRENNLPRVDFIKSDIEGFERYLLEGAQETLKNFAPKLALCTYHLPDDPEVMAGLIKKANPKYNIVQKKMKLFASVPK